MPPDKEYLEVEDERRIVVKLDLPRTILRTLP